MNKASCTLIIQGRVQGVCMRVMCKERAEELHIGGYAQNNLDGTVTVALFGKKQQVKDFLSWLKSSPGISKVDKVDVHWGEWYHGREQFTIRY